MSTFELKMPKLGESITEGTIMQWLVKEGDDIKEDDILFEVNTAKVNAEIPSPVAGRISKIFFEEGTTLAIGTVVAQVTLEGTEESTSNEGAEAKKASEPSSAKTPEPSTEKTSPQVQKHDNNSKWYSPIVLQKAKEYNLSMDELDKIQGSGYMARLTKKDLEKYIEHKKTGIKESSPAATKEISKLPSRTVESVQVGEDEVVQMDFVRRIIAERMLESKKISPHVTNVIEIDVSKLVKWRESNKEAFKKRENINLTYMPAVVQATTKSLIDFPQVNVSVNENTIIFKKHINIGIAVSLNDGNLVVPVIKDADKLSPSGLALEIDHLANKARRNKLTLDEIQGGTFTITNLGSSKTLFGTPIINQPEVAILGIGLIQKKPAVISGPDGDMIAIRHKMYLSFSFDHRVIDGTLGGEFLRRLGDYLENWEA